MAGRLPTLGRENVYFFKTSIASGTERRYAPADGSSIPEIAADLRPSADGSAVRSPHISGGYKLQTASVPIA